MSHDGSSCKSYIKHPTEKSRLDNLAFTSFPEDYLPYTSPSYQRKAPYLVWDHHNYDGGGLFKSKRRRLRRCCCGTTTLVSAVVLLIAAILAIVAVSVYLGVVTNLFRSPIYTLSGRIRILEGDEFEEALLNQTSTEFLIKAEYYKTLIEGAFAKSSLAEAFVTTRIMAFRPGSLLVFFRLHLDRRKLQDDDAEVVLTAKNVLLGEAMMTPSPSFSNLILDLPFIDVREYDDEDWLTSPEFYLDPQDSISFDLNDDIPNDINESSPQHSGTTASTTSTLSTTTTFKPKLITSKVTSSTRKPTSVPSNRTSSNVGYGYAEWKPIELPEAIQVASLGVQQSDSKPEFRVPSSNRGESRVEFVKPANAPQTPNNVASSITSSVSLFIRPSLKNSSSDVGVGVVKAVALDDEDRPLRPELERKGRLDESLKDPDDKYGSLRISIAEINGEPAKNETLSLLDQHDVRVIDPSEIFPSTHETITSQSMAESSSTNTDQSTISNNEALGNGKHEVISDENESSSSSSFTTTTFSPRKETSTQHNHNITTNLVTNFKPTTIESLGHDYFEESTPSSKDYSTNLDVLITTMQTLGIVSSVEEDSSGLFEIWESENESTPYEVLTATSTAPTAHSKFEDNSDVQEHTTTTIRETDFTIFEDHDSTSTENTIETDQIQNSVTTIAANVSTTLLQDLQRFRKIVQPLRENNPNDINEKDDIQDNLHVKPYFPHNTKNTSVSSSVIVFGDRLDKNDLDVGTIPSTFVANDSAEYIDPIVIACLETEMVCGSGECVPLEYRCNMRHDCKDNSDEEFCSCADYLTVIGQSQKICDGIRDCSDHSDEENCPWCSAGQFLCPQSKFCVNSSQVCDGTNDCPFGTDERYCVKLADDEESAMSVNYFSEGYLMVRKNGLWGKLCFDAFKGTNEAISLRWKLDELGKAVCNALTYRHLDEAMELQDTELHNQFYFGVKGHPLESPSQHSSAMFLPSSCPSKDVVHVKCKSLECGLRPMAVSSLRRIVGGQSTGSGSWPWQVALYKEGEFQCGAVLVSDIWLISAGHCFYSTQTAYWTARMGILRRGTELKSPTEQIRKIVQIILHPDYIDKGFINDIALLKLETPVPFSDYLRPLCLPTEEEDVKIWNGQYCSVVGWGKLYEIGHTFPDSLQEVRLPVISTEECRKRIFFLSMYHITDNMFCAGFEEGGRDACLGDSGGPLMCQRQDGRFVLLGVTSNGDGCGRPGRPGVYTKVTQYLSWIRAIMSEEEMWPVNSTDQCVGHRCELGRCVQHYKVCDGKFDCYDGSDERGCPRPQSENNYKVENQ